MSQRTPWWYSGDDEVPAEPQAETAHEAVEGDLPDEESGSSARDWMALVAGAQRVVDWATERVMAPHSEHDDPGAHPDCVVCRTMVMLGDVGLRTHQPVDDDADTATAEAADASPNAGPPEPERQAIEWIPIRGEGQEP